MTYTYTPSVDPAKAIKDAMAAHFAADYPLSAPLDFTPSATMEVDDNYDVQTQPPIVLVANDGGGGRRDILGVWDLAYAWRNPTIRITTFAPGRTVAYQMADELSSWIIPNRPTGIARIEDISEILVTRDRETHAFMAWFTMPVIVKP
jgi:hypothetical protein